MREIRTSGSVGAPGEQSPGATRRAPAALAAANPEPQPRAAQGLRRGARRAVGLDGGARAHETVFAVDVEFAPGDCARAGWMMELAADRVMAIVPG